MVEQRIKKEGGLAQLESQIPTLPLDIGLYE